MKKIKLLASVDTNVFENNVNDFIKGKNVIDIKFAIERLENQHTYFNAMVIYDA